MRAGLLKTRIEFIEKTEVTNDSGGRSVTWSIYKTKWCRWKTIKETEKVTGDAIENPTDALVTIRYDNTITTAMRIRKDGKHYGITGKVNMGEANAWLELSAYEMRKQD